MINKIKLNTYTYSQGIWWKSGIHPSLQWCSEQTKWTSNVKGWFENKWVPMGLKKHQSENLLTIQPFRKGWKIFILMIFQVAHLYPYQLSTLPVHFICWDHHCNKECEYITANNRISHWIGYCTVNMRASKKYNHLYSWLTLVHNRNQVQEVSKRRWDFSFLIKKEVGFQVSWIIFFPAINATSVFYNFI